MARCCDDETNDTPGGARVLDTVQRVGKLLALCNKGRLVVYSSFGGTVVVAVVSVAVLLMVDNNKKVVAEDLLTTNSSHNRNTLFFVSMANRPRCFFSPRHFVLVALLGYQHFGTAIQ